MHSLDRSDYFSSHRNPLTRLLHVSVSDDSLLHILSFLDRRSLCNLRLAHSSFGLAVFSSHDRIWQPILEELRVLYSIHADSEAAGDVSASFKSRAQALLRLVYDDCAHVQAAYLGKGVLDVEALVRLQPAGSETLSETEPDAIVKIVFVGDPGAGKSAVMQSLFSGEFDPDYLATVFDRYFLPLDRIGSVFGPFALDLWDTAGGEMYSQLRPLSYGDVDVFVICCDLARCDTFRNITKWKREIHLHDPKAKIVVCGCKADVRIDVDELKHNAGFNDGTFLFDPEIHFAVDLDAAREISKAAGADFYVESSARTGRTKQVACVVLVAHVIKNHRLILKSSEAKKCNLM